MFESKISFEDFINESKGIPVHIIIFAMRFPEFNFAGLVYY